MNTPYTFREMTNLTKLLRILLVTGAAMAIVSLISNCLQLELLERGTFSQAEGQANDSRQQVIALLTSVLFFATVAVFCCWIYRANKNVRALGALGLRFTPGWAVGYFFIPVIWLWKPYQAMKDLWRASKNPGAWQSIKPGSILGIWWTLWIIFSFEGTATFTASMRAHDIEGLKMVTFDQQFSDGVNIPLCIVALILVSQILKFQNAARAANIPTPPLTVQSSPIAGGRRPPLSKKQWIVLAVAAGLVGLLFWFSIPFTSPASLISLLLLLLCFFRFRQPRDRGIAEEGILQNDKFVGAQTQASEISQSLNSGSNLKTGVVNVAAEDASFDVFADGAFVGNPPTKLKLSEGSHVIEVKKAGFKDYKKEIKVTDGSELNLKAVLEKE